MLLELKVSNFAIIDNVHIQFRDGLNILSGETGAGKSVLLKGLAMLMGYKGSSETIRSGCDRASIEGSFDLRNRRDILKRLKDLGIDTEDNTLVVRRVIGSDKSSRVYLNGTIATLASLRDLVSPLIEVAGHAVPLIEMTGQHENRNLMSRSYHLDMLDLFAGVWTQRMDYSQKYERRQQILLEIENLKQSESQRAQRLDYLQFQKNEIELLNPTETDLQIEAQVKMLRNSAKLYQFVESAEEALISADDSALSRIQITLSKAKDFLGAENSIVDRLSQAKALLEDAMYDLSRQMKELETGPEQLEKLEHRLSELRKLQKKFGPEIGQILESYQNISSEIESLQNSESRIESLQAEESRLHSELRASAQGLHKSRMNSASKLSKSVNAELADLNMKGVEFGIHIEPMTELTPTGISDVEFCTRSGKADELRPLAKFASGGELSRVLLALKRVIGTSDYPRTYLFDEVDTGVSGPTAEKVGRKLKSIAKGQQVLCITHLPQVAAFADWHFFIQKSTKSGQAVMQISELKPMDRSQEIARLISGEKITKTSLQHAKQLIAEAQQ